MMMMKMKRSVKRLMKMRTKKTLLPRLKKD